jgi:class 3 adenylate cyclase
MCFVDLTGYTKLTEERGDEAAAELAAALGEIVQATVNPHDGHAVKWLGDGVMLSFRRAPDAVVAALELVASTDRHDLPAAHVGVHAGPVVVRDGDYFGRTVNLASRISGRAGPREVLVTAEVVSESDGVEVAFEPVGPIELKGVAAPVALFRASPGR